MKTMTLTLNESEYFCIKYYLGSSKLLPFDAPGEKLFKKLEILALEAGFYDEPEESYLANCGEEF